MRSRKSSPGPVTSVPRPADHAQLPGPRPGCDARPIAAKGADAAEETQGMEGVGRFGWVTDPEGNRVELWQPA
jgi:hypothetical protein